jgi:hypothetical protein
MNSVHTVSDSRPVLNKIYKNLFSDHDFFYKISSSLWQISELITKNNFHNFLACRYEFGSHCFRFRARIEQKDGIFRLRTLSSLDFIKMDRPALWSFKQIRQRDLPRIQTLSQGQRFSAILYRTVHFLSSTVFVVNVFRVDRLFFVHRLSQGYVGSPPPVLALSFRH